MNTINKKTKKQQNPNKETCPKCHGSGDLPGKRGNHSSVGEVRKCWTCNGTGQIDKITQSPNWDEVKEFITQSAGKRINGFPFNIPFPTQYTGKIYEIITVSGELYMAKVDDSNEFMSEGLEWKTIGADRDGNKPKAVVAAWKLLT